MSKAFREAIWAREKAAPKKKPRPPAPRKTNFPISTRTVPSGRSSVVRVLPGGKVEVVMSRLTPDAADKEAGKMRDRMPDSDVAKGWNYLPRHHRL